METQGAAQNARSLTDLLRRRRDPAGDLPFDPNAEPPMEGAAPPNVTDMPSAQAEPAL